MNLEIISILISCFGVIWAIYVFIIKRREEQFDRDRQALVQMIRELSGKTTEEYRRLTDQLILMQRDFEKVKTNTALSGGKIDSQSQLLVSQAKLFEESVRRIDKVLDRHESKLDGFGSIKVK